MTQEEKQLVFIDLCARLPFKPHVYIKDGKVDIDIDIVLNGTYIHEWLTFPSCQNITIKPYLRPMSSMTDEEREEWADLFNLELDKLNEIDDENKAEELAPYYFGKSHQVSIDWLNKNMFDYRGLIEMGLAIEAPEGMYKNE